MPGASRDIVPIFRSAFESPLDEFNPNLGVRPVVFDILAPDLETSVLPDDLKLVLHVNPSSMTMSYEKAIERTQTKGGWVEFHWGEGPRNISFNMATGGFKRLYSGLSNVTGGGYDTGGTRRETIAYDKYLDILAVFHNNGSIYDTKGSIVFQGIIKVTFDGGIYYGWFSGFSVEEAAEQPYQFSLSAEFTLSHEVLRLRSFISPEPEFVAPGGPKMSQSAGEAQPVQAGDPQGQKTAPENKVPVAAKPDRPVDPTFSTVPVPADEVPPVPPPQPQPPEPEFEFGDPGVPGFDVYDNTTPGWTPATEGSAPLDEREYGNITQPDDEQPFGDNDINISPSSGTA